MMDPKTKDSDLDRLFSINELADEFGIDKDAILFYEKKELIFPGKRRVLGLSYNEFDKFRLKFIEFNFVNQ